jgi:hypothetical protein|tara:strand:- start:5157 stop:5609 length:453 start_codon:yes stop_codon:yes gene_type:complete
MGNTSLLSAGAIIMAAIKAQFKSGDLVRVKASVFKTNWNDTVDDTISSNYHVTREDTEQWYADKRRATEEAIANGEDTFHINMQSDGESRLPPMGGSTPLYRGIGYRVLRARCRESFSYGNATGGWTKLLDLETGREVFVKMTKLEKVVV